MPAPRLALIGLLAATATCSSSTESWGPSSGSPSLVTTTGSATAAADTAGTELVTFSDPSSGFETSDVLDADREVMQFDAGHSSLLWAADGARIDGWVAQGNGLSWTGIAVAFQVRFGTEAGVRHAYFTEAESGTICNLEVNTSGQLSIFGTSELPPQ